MFDSLLLDCLSVPSTAEVVQTMTCPYVFPYISTTAPSSLISMKGKKHPYIILFFPLSAKCGLPFDKSLGFQKH